MDIAEFIAARLAEEEPPERCGCLDANHWPPCTPQPWRDRIWREIAAKRAILAEHLPVESIYGVACGRCVSWQDAPLAEGGETEFGIAIPDPWPCVPVRAAGVSWGGHPDYDPGWALGSPSWT
jgi:hypothetical protein